MQITVDGDTSTNDTVIGLAGGAADNRLIDQPGSKAADQLHAAVTALLQVCVRSVFQHGRHVPSVDHIWQIISHE